MSKYTTPKNTPPIPVIDGTDEAVAKALEQFHLNYDRTEKARRLLEKSDEELSERDMQRITTNCLVVMIQQLNRLILDLELAGNSIVKELQRSQHGNEVTDG